MKKRAIEKLKHRNVWMYSVEDAIDVVSIKVSSYFIKRMARVKDKAKLRQKKICQFKKQKKTKYEKKWRSFFCELYAKTKWTKTVSSDFSSVIHQPFGIPQAKFDIFFHSTRLHTSLIIQNFVWKSLAKNVIVANDEKERTREHAERYFIIFATMFICLFLSSLFPFRSVSFSKFSMKIKKKKNETAKRRLNSFFLSVDDDRKETIEFKVNFK